jgi:hypothetical protein
MKRPHLVAFVALLCSGVGLFLIFEVVRPFRDLNVDGPLALAAWGVGTVCAAAGFFLRERSIALSAVALVANVLPLAGTLALLWMLSRSSFGWRCERPPSDVRGSRNVTQDLAADTNGRMRFGPGGIPLLALLVLLGCSGCDQRSGEAIVLGKERIPPAETLPLPGGDELPLADARSMDASTFATGRKPKLGESALEQESDVRGTARDPRAVSHEQWIVNVQMVADRRLIDVRVEQPQWEKLKEGDRVQVTHRVGRFTDTVWSAKIK